jgi:catalase-peroxidase
MQKKMTLKSTIVGFFSMALMSGVAFAESAEMTKPKGAMGTGSVKEGQPKSNQFWWPDQLDLSALRDHDAKSNP